MSAASECKVMSDTAGIYLYYATNLSWPELNAFCLEIDLFNELGAVWTHTI